MSCIAIRSQETINLSLALCGVNLSPESWSHCSLHVSYFVTKGRLGNQFENGTADKIAVSDSMVSKGVVDVQMACIGVGTR